MSSAFQHVLVPVDFSQKNNEALKVAKTIAKQNRSHVTLVHVIETIDYVADDEIAEFYEKLKKNSKTRLQFLADLFTAEDISVESKTIMGNRARGVVTYAMQHDVDLVVLSSHKIEIEETTKGWSTLSYQIAVLCPCPVLLVK